MYAVIFTAEVAAFDADYSHTAERLRELALQHYGCREFISSCENGREIAISYWDSEEQIAAWKKDAEHLSAQRAGRERWYRSYRVQVVKVTREYSR